MWRVHFYGEKKVSGKSMLDPYDYADLDLFPEDTNYRFFRTEEEARLWAEMAIETIVRFLDSERSDEFPPLEINPVWNGWEGKGILRLNPDSQDAYFWEAEFHIEIEEFQGEIDSSLPKVGKSDWEEWLLEEEE